ncbi:MAG: GAF domain-containing protein [Chloroflexi bacterium]|nr:GAF domain-containing protein [Chloroflexota bacterium]
MKNSELEVTQASTTSIQRRLRLLALALSLIFALAGAASIYFSYQWWQLTRNQQIVLRMDASTARVILHTQKLLEALQSSYAAQDVNYLKENVRPWIDQLKEDQAELQQLIAAAPKDAAPRQVAEEAYPQLKKIINLSEGIISQAEIGNWPSAKVRFQYLEESYEQYIHDYERLLKANSEYLLSSKTMARLYLRIAILPAILALLGIFVTIMGTLGTQRVVLNPLKELTASVQHFAEGDFTIRLPEDRDDEIGVLAHTFNLMADRIQEARANLTQQVEERTLALQRRTAQLQAATEIGRAVTTLREVDELLTHAARLISQRYGYYHVGLFLNDEASGTTRLRAAYTQNGKAAEKLLAEGYQLPIGMEGPVSQTASTGRLHIAQYGAQHPHPVEDLSRTRAEAAFPLKSGDTVLGVLDVHSNTDLTFSPEDIAALQSVADLLAIALENARLFQETERALEAARRAYAQLSQESWERFLKPRTTLGFRVDSSGEIQPIAASEVEEAEAQAEEAPAENADTTPQEETQESGLLDVPITIRERPIAVARLRKATPWTATEKQLVARLAERIGNILESARLFSEAQRRAAQLQIAAEIARDTSGTLDLDELLSKAINLVRERFGFYHASVFLLDETGRYGVVKESTGEAGEQLKARQHRLAVGSASIIGQTLASGQPVVVNDVRKSDIHHYNPLLPDTRAELGIPLKVGEEVIGALDVQSTVVNAFTEEDVRVLHILADQLAIAVVNARLFAETQKHLMQHRLLHQITAAAAAATTVEEAIRNTVESLHATRPDEGVSLLVPAEDQPNTLRIAAWAGYSASKAERIRQIRIPFGEAVTGKVAATQQPLIVPDTSAIPDHIAISSRMRSELAVPLVYRGELLGVLDLESPKPNNYDEHDREMMLTLASSLAAIFANIRLLEQVRRHSDELTLLYEVTATASSHVDLDTLLNQLALKLQESMDLLHCGVVLFNRDGKTGTLVASASSPDAPGKDMIGTQLPLDNPLTQEVIRTQKPALCRDVETDPRVADIRDLLRQRGTKQIIILPLLARDEVVGTLGLDIAQADREFTDADLRLLEQIARQIATSIEVARLFRQAVRTAERERMVTYITTKMRASNDPQEILQTAVEELRRALKAQQTQILLLPEERDTGPENNGSGEG